MQVIKFWARGYRSLREVEMTDLGRFVILYGPNGSGKSNVLDGLQTLLALLPIAVDTAYGPDDERRSFWDAGKDAATWVRDDDFHGRESTQDIVLGMQVEDARTRFGGHQFRGQPVTRVHVELRVRRADSTRLTLKISHLAINGVEPGLPFFDADLREILRSIVPESLNHIGVTRRIAATPWTELTASRVTGTILEDDLVTELFQAKNSNDPTQRDRFTFIQRYIEQSLGHVVDVYVDRDKQIEMRTRLPEPNPLGVDIGVDHAGHGLVQMYAMLAAILLREGRLVALEEPEAHLHAPTMGRKLRSLLHDLVDREQRVDQLFIATHSNLFDLDQDGYWDVALVHGETVIRRLPLDEIDRLHLYEPGPAKHQIQAMLRLYGDDIVFRTADGRALVGRDMLKSLQVDDDVAQAFLEAMHAAAMQVTGLRAKREQGRE